VQNSISDYTHLANSGKTIILCWRGSATGSVSDLTYRNRFQGTGSKIPEPVPTPGIRNRFLNIVSLTHCIICALYESLFVNNESRLEANTSLF